MDTNTRFPRSVSTCGVGFRAAAPAPNQGGQGSEQTPTTRHRWRVGSLSASLMVLGCLLMVAWPEMSPAQNFTVGVRLDYATGAAPLVVAIGDVSGDGNPDLAVANSSASTVSVLLGTGTGGFGAKTDFPTGTNPRGVAILGRERRRQARPGGGEPGCQHGVDAARQRCGRVRGQDRLRDRDESRLGCDRRRERRRQGPTWR